MDWAVAIERHRKPLLRIVATLFVMLGLSEDRPVEKAARPVYRAVLRLLRPAESAVRRLIVAAARGIVVKPPDVRAVHAKRAIAGKGKVGRKRAVAFRLFDPRQRLSTSYRFRRHPLPPDFHRPQPRIRILGEGFGPRVPLFLRAAPAPAMPPPPTGPDDTVPALRLSRRLVAIKSALEDLPRQARRYARWQARPADRRRPRLPSALRPGRPPGHREKPVHKVDRLLAECDWLARQASRPDTS